MDWLPLKISKHSKPNGRMDTNYSKIIVQDNNKISFVGINKTLELDLTNILLSGNDDKYAVDVYYDEADIPNVLRLDDEKNPSFWFQIGVELA